MSGVTPSWLQEIRDYWAHLAHEQRDSHAGERTHKAQALPQGEKDQDRVSHVQASGANMAAAVATSSTDN